MKSLALFAYRRMPRGLRSKLRDWGFTHFVRSLVDGNAPSLWRDRARREAERLFGLAKAALQAGDFVSAEQQVRAALDQFPDYGRFHRLAAEVAFRQGRSDDALARARNALLLGTADRETALLTIRLAIERGVPTPEIMSLLNGLPSAGFWEACKSCDRPDLFEALLARSTASNGAISYKLVRPLSVAATRVENFSAARHIVIKGFEAFLQADKKADSGMRGSLGPAGLTALEDAADILNAAGIRFFAAAGTALGIVREGAPLKHDVDIDIGILEQDFDRQRLTEIFLLDPRFWPDAPHDKSPKIGLKHRSGASIDLFQFRKENDAYYHDGVFVRWRNDQFDLEPRKVGRAMVNIPANADHYLTENYGDWRVPDKTFDAFVSGPNREITWPEYYGVHLLRATFIAFTNGNMEKFRYMADQVQYDGSIPDPEKAFIQRIVEMAS